MDAAVTGLAATSALNGVTATGLASVPVTGLQATGIVNGLPQNVTVFLTAADASGWGRATWGDGAWSQPVATDIGMTASVGSVSVSLVKRVPVTGLEVTTGVGSVSVLTGTGIDVPVTGLSASGLIGPRGVTVWGRIVPSPTTTWTNIAPNRTTEYTEIRP